MGAVCLAISLTGPAAASGDIAPTSSTSVNISVSVAPTYGLGGRRPAQARGGPGPARLCMASNGPPTLLPIMLVRSGPGGSTEAAQPLAWCGSAGGAAEQVEQVEQGAAGAPGASALLIIRPE